MATDAPLLENVSQRRIQEKLLQYHVAPPVARCLALQELTHWTPDQVDSILRKVDARTPDPCHFVSDSGPVRESGQRCDRWVRPPPSMIEQAAGEKAALCVNAGGEWSLRTSDFVAISHVWEEGIQADSENRGLLKSVLDSIFAELASSNVSWICLDWLPSCCCAASG
jgi:hypothetical protein